MITREKENEYAERIYEIIGAAYEVYKELKYGIAEAVYEEALCMELQQKGMQCSEQSEVLVYYKDILLKKRFRLDIVVENDIIVELKAVEELMPEHRAQLFNYMRLTHKPIGLLINFGRSVEVEKYVYDVESNEISIFTKKMIAKGK